MAGFSVACKSCGNVESYAYETEGEKMGQRSTRPLTPQGHVPIYCQKCGQRNWRVPATADDVEKFEAQQRRQARAVELCGSLNIDGLLKVPDEIHCTSEVKQALSNLFAPLEGDVLRAAQANAIKIARSGVTAPADVWVELYDKAVAKALKDGKGAKAPA